MTEKPDTWRFIVGVVVGIPLALLGLAEIIWALFIHNPIF